MAFNFNGTTPTAINFNGSPVYTLIVNGVTVWTAAVTVTYYVDSGKSYQESVIYGNSVLSPTSFTPSKTGYTFVGWRENSTASSSVLTSKTMGTSPISLYAVFKKTVTVTYYNNSTSASSTSGTQYYNNGNVSNPSFTLSQATSSGWTCRGWSTSNAGNASITYNNGATFSRDSNITLYGLYSQTITVTYYNNSTSASTATGTRYWAPAGYINPSFTLAQASVSGWSARGWSTGSAGNSGISYNNNTAFTRDSNITLYGSYSKTVTLSYNGNGSSSGSVSSHSGTAYRNYAGTVIGATFTLKSNGFTKSGYSFSKWASGSASGTQYAAGASVTLSSNTTFYAVWTSNAYYAITNGTRTNCPNATAGQTGSDWWGGSSGTLTTEGVTYYGAGAHTVTDEGVLCYANTGNMSTSGCKYLNIQIYVNIWGEDSTTRSYLTVYDGNGNSIYTKTINNKENNTATTVSIDVSSYSTVRAYIESQSLSQNEGNNGWQINIGFRNVYFSN